MLKKKDEKSVCVTQVYGSLIAQNVFQMSQEIKEKKAAEMKKESKAKKKFVKDKVHFTNFCKMQGYLCL